MTILNARKQDIIKRKLQETFKANQYRIAKEDIIKMLTYLFKIQHNPAFEAAMITGLTESKRLSDFDKEFDDPSFGFPTDNPDYRPAIFTKDYQPTTTYLKYGESSIPDTSGQTYPFKIISVAHDNKPFAKIVL